MRAETVLLRNADFVVAAVLQGAIFALVKAAVDRGAAEGTRRLTGIWPGDEGQQPDEPSDHHQATAAVRMDK